MEDMISKVRANAHLITTPCGPLTEEMLDRMSSLIKHSWQAGGAEAHKMITDVYNKLKLKHITYMPR